MTSWLSERQKAELNKSILDYLSSQGHSGSVESFKSESGQDEYEHDPSAKTAGLLEKKWTSVIRLQKKIMELESKISLLQSELSTRPTASAAAGLSLSTVGGGTSSNPTSTSGGGPLSLPTWLPRAPARHVLLGHRAPITRVTFHPVFNVVVTASEDASMKVWDWETGEFERTIKGHTKAVADCEFDRGGKILASCSSDLSIKIWDVTEDYKCTKTFHHDHTVSAVKFLPPMDNCVVSASRDKTIRVWELSSGHCIKTIYGHDDWIRCVVPSSDGSRFISCSNDQTAKIWQMPQGDSKVELRGHDHVLEVCVFAPVVSHGSIRELAGFPDTQRTNSREQVASFAATGSRDKTIKLWDCQSGQLLWTFNGHNNWVRALVFHPSGNYLLSSSDDKTIKIWDLKTGRCTKTIEAHDHFVSCLSWGRRRVAGSGNPKPGIDGAAPNGVSKDGTGDVPVEEQDRMINVLASGSVDQSVKVWLP